METPQEIAARLPHEPGVYIYKNTSGEVLYVGKAKDLRARVRQYFAGDVPAGSKTAQLVAQIHDIATIGTHSEFDALILEAKLIREYNPKYNIIAKDDKSPLYLSISFDEELPRIEYVRKSAVLPKHKRVYFGPFQSGSVARSVLRQLRYIIPYCTQKRRDGRPCFYTHLGLCTPCPSEISHMKTGAERGQFVRQYRNNCRRIARILSGESLTVLHDMEDDMRIKAKAEQFEEAQILKSSVDRFGQLLQKHYDPSLYTQGESFLYAIYDSEMDELANVLAPFYPAIAKLHRIECIDISNTMGQFATGSLVVLTEGKPDKSAYRRFKIRTKDAPNDFAMIAEVVTRRLKHTEWPYPDLLIIDGGKGQVKMAQSVLTLKEISIPVIGLAKRFEEIIIPTGNSFKTLRLPLAHKGLHLLERIRDESHRFALAYHKLLRKKNFLPAT